MTEPQLPPRQHSQPDIHIWLVEDNAIYAETVELALNQAEGFRCEAVYRRCEDALAALGKRLPPAVILLDIGLPGMTGLEGLHHIKTAAPQVQVVLLTSFDDTQRIFSALRSGASGYLLKSSSEAGILAAVREVLAGGSPYVAFGRPRRAAILSVHSAGARRVRTDAARGRGA